MPKNRAKKSTGSPEEITVIVAANSVDAAQFVQVFLWQAQDRVSAVDWLARLFGAGWVVQGLTKRGNLILSKGDRAVMRLHPLNLTSHCVFGGDLPDHPQPVPSALVNAVKAAALRPSLDRAVVSLHRSHASLLVATEDGDVRVDVSDAALLQALLDFAPSGTP